MPSSFLLLLVFALFYIAVSSNTLVLHVNHRFSDEVRRWSESRSHHFPGGWPDKHSQEYHSALSAHDRGRHLREEKVSFADGNDTIRISSLGFLHYAMVALGTPNVTFLVALDTGSDLFWVPCDCNRCAPTKSGTNGYVRLLCYVISSGPPSRRGIQQAGELASLMNFDYSIYSPSKSSTSQLVPCNSRLCEHKQDCFGVPNCPYNVEYVSADTSSSGHLVEDVLYLTTEDANPKIVKAPIVFGCGQVQTGSFLTAAAPNGLLGLGMEKISVPSTLSSAGITTNSFSMCFGHDGIGRISFGDNGSSDQEETPFNTDHPQSIYSISITGLGVGKSSMGADFSALVDSGTSFTYLRDPAYTNLTKSFNDQVHDKRYIPDSGIPFEYCYYISSIEAVMKLPALSFTTKGGSQFPISDPIVEMTSERRQQSVFCLAVIKSDQLNIIGENFLTGLRLVFDRDRMILGWKKFNCYDIENSNPLPVNPRNSYAVNNQTAEATDESRNNVSEVTMLTPSAACRHFSFQSSFLACNILLFLVFPVAII